jgi:hypothetical protein
MELMHYKARQKVNILDLKLTDKRKIIEDMMPDEPTGNGHHVEQSWIHGCNTDKQKLKFLKGIIGEPSPFHNSQ